MGGKERESPKIATILSRSPILPQFHVWQFHPWNSSAQGGPM